MGFLTLFHVGTYHCLNLLIPINPYVVLHPGQKLAFLTDITSSLWNDIRDELYQNKLGSVYLEEILSLIMFFFYQVHIGEEENKE